MNLSDIVTVEVIFDFVLLSLGLVYFFFKTRIGGKVISFGAFVLLNLNPLFSEVLVTD